MPEDPYHTEFVSWRVDHFSFFNFFPQRGGVSRLVENSTIFFLNPSLIALKLPLRGLKKTLENSSKGGVSDGWFHLRKKNMLIILIYIALELPEYHSRDILFFALFGWWDPSLL